MLYTMHHGNREEKGSYQGSGVEEIGEASKGYKLSIMKWLRSEGLMYNMMTITDNTTLYNWNLLREQNLCSHTHTHK